MKSMNLMDQTKKLGYVAGIAASVSIGSLVISSQQAQALTFFGSNSYNYSNIDATGLNSLTQLNLQQYNPTATQQVSEVHIILSNVSVNGRFTITNKSTTNTRNYSNVNLTLDQYNLIPSTGAPPSPNPLSLQALSSLPTTLIGPVSGSLAPSGSITYGPATINGVSASSIYTNVSDIAYFLGTGTVSFSIDPVTGTSGLNTTIFSSVDNSTTSGILTVEYYGNTTPVPFEFSPGLSIPVFGGVFYGMSYWKKKRHLKTSKLP